MSTPEHDGEVFTLLPHEAARTIAQLRARVAAAEKRADDLKDAILDIDAHATRYGDQADDPDGSPAAYLVTVGSLHRALGKVGHTAAPYHVVLARMVAAEAQVAAVRTALDELDHADVPSGQRFAVGYIRAALDAASTPAPARDEAWAGGLLAELVEWLDGDLRRVEDIAVALSRLDHIRAIAPPYPEPDTTRMPADATVQAEWTRAALEAARAGRPAETTSPSG